MKIQVIAFLLFLVLSSATPNKNMGSADQLQWNSLKNGSSWAKVILNFAELGNMSQGALDELAQAIADLIGDLEAKITRATEDFMDRTNEHNSEVTRLNDIIDSANLDISENTEFLDNVLYVQRDQLNSDIARLEQNIEDNLKYIDEETTLRAQEHQAYLTRIAEHQDAVAAVEECLEILSQLENGESELTMVQMNKQLDRVKTKLGKNADAALVEALLALGTSDFTDQALLQKVQELLRTVGNNLTASIAKSHEDEETAVQEFNADIATKRAEIGQYTLQKMDAQAQLTRTNEQIAATEEFIGQRQDDLEEAESDLQEENEAFQAAEEHYNALVEQLNSEKQACHEAQTLLENNGFAGYIEDRVQQGHSQVVAQGQGSGISVFGSE